MFRGEVWRMLVTARSANGEGSHRMVVIVSSDALGLLPLKVVVPITPWKEEYSSAPWMIRLPPVLNSGLEFEMAADSLQIRSVSTARLVKRLGELPEKFINDIVVAVSMILEEKRL